MNLLKKPYFLQGLYFLLTGIWPLLHIDSFMLFSGPKTDLWLVKTVGLLAAVIGLCFLYHASIRKGHTSRELILLGIASAAGFGCIDIYYAWIDRIWDVYLLDALAQMVFIALWIYYIMSRSDKDPRLNLGQS